MKAGLTMFGTGLGEASAIMADLRTSAAGASLVPQARTPDRREAANAAQRAFFQAALNGVAPAAATSARIAQSPVSPAAAVQAARSDGDPPSRLLRPGSLLDIKV